MKREKHPPVITFENGRLSWENVEPHQIVGPDGVLWLVFAGGYAKPSDSSNCGTLSPAEAVGLAFARYGERFASSLYGQFWAVLCRQGNGTMVIAQDVLGLSPVFYSVDCNRSVASPSLGALAHSKRFRTPLLDIGYFAEVIAREGVLTRRTPYKNISRLALGEIVVCVHGEASIRSTWMPNIAAKHERVSDAVARLTELLNKVVEDAVVGVAKERVWCEVSGGWDSSCVFSVARQCLGAVTPFSWLRTNDEPGTDTVVLRELEPWLGEEWRTMDPTAHPPFSILPRGFDEPGNAIDAGRAKAYGNELQTAEVGCVLTGMGGDHVFGSQDMAPAHLAEGLLSWNLGRLWRDLSTWAEGNRRGHGRLYALRSMAWPEMLAARRSYARARLAPPTPWSSTPAMMTTLAHADTFTPRLPRNMPWGRRVLWNDVFMLASLLSLQRQSPWALFRHPLLDRRILEFGLTLPNEWRRTSARDRRLQRLALQAQLPPAVRSRQSKGTGQATLDAALKLAVEGGPWSSLLHRMDHLVGMGLVDRDKWKLDLDRASFGVCDHPGALLTACELEAWLADLMNHPSGPID